MGLNLNLLFVMEFSFERMDNVHAWLNHTEVRGGGGIQGHTLVLYQTCLAWAYD